MTPILKWFQKRTGAVALVALGLLAGFWLAARPGGGESPVHGDAKAATAEATEATQGRQQVYTCSMHPQVRSTDPNAKCPICGMDLIPVPEDDDPDADQDGPQLRLTPRAAALMQLEVLPAERRTIEMPVRLFGRLEQDETRQKTISAWIGGRIERLYVDFTGVTVRQGQPMAELYSPRLIAAQEELLQAIKADRELAAGGSGVVQETTRLTVDASRDRLRLLGLDPAQIAELEQRGRVQEQVTIPAPVSGVVMERLVAQGDYVETGQPIVRIADLARLWALLEVYETELQWLSVGQQARFTTQSHPGREFTGTVSFIDPAIDPRTRTARVRVEIPNPDGRLKPGMFVRGVVGAVPDPGEEHRHAGAGPHDHGERHERDHEMQDGLLVIPASAPLITGRRAVVYVQRPDADRPTFEPRDVLLGPRAGDWYVVEEGLAEGELVVARGAFKIDSELQIRGRPSMMQPEGGPPPVHDHGGHDDHAGGSDHTRHEPPAQTKEGDQPASAQFQAPGEFRTGLGALVESQFALVRALADDDPEAARGVLLDIDAALHAVDGSGLPAGDARRAWNRLGRVIHDALSELGRAPGLEGQRRHFETFSDALTEAVQAFGIAGTGPVYRAVCPMVQGRDGYWLQDEETVANPYHGEAMLRCGWVHETIDGNGP